MQSETRKKKWEIKLLRLEKTTTFWHELGGSSREGRVRTMMSKLTSSGSQQKFALHPLRHTFSFGGCGTEYYGSYFEWKSSYTLPVSDEEGRIALVKL